jgi:hypothetical protein
MLFGDCLFDACLLIQSALGATPNTATAGARFIGRTPVAANGPN